MPPPSKKQDAVESAKIVSKPSPMSMPAPAEAPPPPAPTAPPPPAAPVSSAASYRVKATTTISLHGQMVTLPVDAIISASSYGPNGMQRILDSNVPLEKLE